MNSDSQQEEAGSGPCDFSGSGNDGWNRRGFLKASAAAILGMVLTRLPAMAGPFTRADLPAISAGIGDLTLKYLQPASRWTEALPIGNGRLGAMVWGGAASERLDLNEDTLWSGEPYDNLNPDGLKALPEIRRLLLVGNDKEAQRLVERDMNGKYNES